MKLENLTLVEAASEIRERRLSPVEYVQYLLERIGRLEPKLHAWVTLDADSALKEAADREAELGSGKVRGPLHGVPVGIKDIFCTKGLKTTAGSRFLQQHVPEEDAESVTRLRDAGAIILGKTVTTEFASFDPGPTCNPWNLGHTPGGSSSGSAAAVAARMCPAATGSQTVASIGRPASYCGVVGFMPTQSRVSREGVFPVSWSLDHVGGLFRTVADAELMFEVLSGVPATRTSSTPPFRVGLLGGMFSFKASEEMRDYPRAVFHKLNSPDFLVREVKATELPAIFDIQASILQTILRVELAAAHTEYYASYSNLYSAKLRALIETGMLVDAPDYLSALRLRKIYQREMAKLFEDFDVLITPGATGTAPEGLGHTGDPGFSGPWALADFPTLTIPGGLAANGMPLGIQISAAALNEELLFSFGKTLEQAIGYGTPLPPSAD